MTLRVIDLETTGTDAETDRIIEIASIDLKSNGAYENPMEVFVAQSAPIPPESSAVHHIIDADVKDAPSIESVIEKFANADVYIAHNQAFEEKFLKRFLGEKTWICTYKVALRLFPEFKSHSNQALRYALGLINPLGVPREKVTSHRGLSDCLVTGAIFFEALKHCTFKDMVAWTKEPAMISRINFGKKHRGQLLREVPTDYLVWVSCSSEMDADIKFACGKEVERRRQERAA